VLVAGIQAHRLSEQVASGFRLADLEQRVSQVLSDGGAAGRKANGLLEGGDRGGVILEAQRLVGFFEGTVRWIRGLGGGDGGEEE
jgi:hypothetical protein